jgi:hypothetical protein
MGGGQVGKGKGDVLWCIPAFIATLAVAHQKVHHASTYLFLFTLWGFHQLSAPVQRKRNIHSFE